MRTIKWVIILFALYVYDPRNVYLSTESMIVIYGKTFAEEVIDEMDRLCMEIELREAGFLIRALSYIVPAIEPML